MTRRTGAVFRTRIFEIYKKNSILDDQKLDSMRKTIVFCIDSAQISSICQIHTFSIRLHKFNTLRLRVEEQGMRLRPEHCLTLLIFGNYLNSHYSQEYLSENARVIFFRSKNVPFGVKKWSRLGLQKLSCFGPPKWSRFRALKVIRLDPQNGPV